MRRHADGMSIMAGLSLDKRILIRIVMLIIIVVTMKTVLNALRMIVVCRRGRRFFMNHPHVRRTMRSFLQHHDSIVIFSYLAIIMLFHRWPRGLHKNMFDFVNHIQQRCIVREWLFVQDLVHEFTTRIVSSPFIVFFQNLHRYIYVKSSSRGIQMSCVIYHSRAYLSSWQSRDTIYDDIGRRWFHVFEDVTFLYSQHRPDHKQESFNAPI